MVKTAVPGAQFPSVQGKRGVARLLPDTFLTRAAHSPEWLLGACGDLLSENLCKEEKDPEL